MPTMARGRPRQKAGPLVSQIPKHAGTVMWANTTFVCTCVKTPVAAKLCNHMQSYFAECNDVGTHTTISVATRGRRYEVALPFTGTLAMMTYVQVITHYSDPNESMIRVTDAKDPTIETLLTREDGLIKFMRMAADAYRSTEIYANVLDRLCMRKRLPCQNDKHNKVRDIYLVNRIKELAMYRDNVSVTGDTFLHWHESLLPILEEVALEETYWLTHEGQCVACHEMTFTAGNVPDDLVPVL